MTPVAGRLGKTSQVQPWILSKVGDIGVYTNPDEVAFHLGHPEGAFFGCEVPSELAGLEALFQAAPMTPLAVTSCLREALRTIFCARLSMVDRSAFVLVSNCKASVVLGCCHASCPVYWFDSRVATLKNIDLSATTVSYSPDDLHRAMCAEDLYDPKSSALIFQFESWTLRTSSSLCPCAMHDVAAKHRDESQEELQARPVILGPLIVYSLHRISILCRRRCRPHRRAWRR